MLSTTTQQKEEVLIITYQQSKCNKAFTELYEMYYSPLFDYVCKITGNAEDAFDITQETFITVSQELDKLRIPLTFRFWLFRIAKHKCMKHFRATAKLNLDIYEADTAEQSYDLTEAIDKDATLEQLDIILSSLTPEDRNLLIAKYSEGKSIREIMDTTLLGSSAIKMKLMRARNKVATGLSMHLYHN